MYSRRNVCGNFPAVKWRCGEVCSAPVAATGDVVGGDGHADFYCQRAEVGSVDLYVEMAMKMRVQRICTAA